MNCLLAIGAEFTVQLPVKARPVVDRGPGKKNTLLTFAKIPVPEAGRSISVNEVVATSSTPRSCVTSVPLRVLMVSTPEYERFAGGSPPGIPADGAASNARNVVAESRRPAPVIIPSVHNPMGLAQLVVVNVLWMRPCTRWHSSA